MRILKNCIIVLLLANAITPLVVWSAVIFPYVFPKAIFSRSLIELTLICALVYGMGLLRMQPVASLQGMRTRLQALASNPLVIALGFLFVSLAISTFLATDKFWAFWGGSLERGDGLWSMLHILLFFILGTLFFSREHWVLFFKISLAAGVVLAVRTFFEYVGMFGYVKQDRPHSFVGNPAYLATQMLFLVAFAALVFDEARRASSQQRVGRIWRDGALVLAMLFLTVMVLTKTRGALLGFAVGGVAWLAYYAFRSRTESEVALGARAWFGVSGSQPMSSRTAAMLALGLTGVFAAVFFLTRDALVWQSVPGLDRLARTSLFDHPDLTTRIRLSLWGLSWEAFKERPFFGWGPEHYLAAFERYYDPGMAAYGEIWLDRAHNKLIDVLVMQGAFGLMAYLGVFGAALYLVAKLEKGPKAILFAALLAYFVQNLVLFDQLLSYLCFFALLGYILRLWWDERQAEIGYQPDAALTTAQKRTAHALMGGAVLAMPFLVFALYQWNAVPLFQAQLYKRAMASNSVDEIVATLERAMTPYNYAQASIRAGEIDVLYLEQFFHNDQYRSNPQFAPLGDTLIKGMQEVVDRHPAYDARFYTRLVEMLNGYARGDATYYARAEPLIRRALLIAPSHQELHFHLSFNLAGQGRFDESIRAAQHAVDLSPDVARAHFKLGLIYAVMGDHTNGQRAIARMEALDPALGALSISDRGILNQLYRAWGMPEKPMPAP